MSEWIKTDTRRPDDEQTVLGFWPTGAGPYKDSIESVTYHASDTPIDGRESWSTWNGEEADEPSHWRPLIDVPAQRLGL